MNHPAAQQIFSALDSIPPEQRNQIMHVVDGLAREVQGRTFKGEAGAGMVCVHVNADGFVIKTEVDLHPSKENQELLASLFTCAYGNAIQTLKEEMGVLIQKLLHKIKRV